MSKTKINKKKFFDLETDTLLYGDYLPMDIIRNEVIKITKEVIKFEFILWNILTEEQESKFLKSLEAHKSDILSVRTEKIREHYIIEAKP